MLSRERAQVAQTTTLAARSVQSKIASTVSAYVRPLEELATAGIQTEQVNRFRAAYPAYESITWHRPEAHQKNVSLGEYTISGAVIETIRKAGRTTVLPSGSAGRSLLVLVPLTRGASTGGLVIGVLKTQAWLDSLVNAEIPRGYAVSISDPKEPIYVRDFSTSQNTLPYGSEAQADLYGLPWLVRVWPSAKEWMSSAQIIFVLTLAIGLLIYVSGALVVVARRKTMAVETSGQELQQVNDRLEAVFEASPFAIIGMDSEGRVKSWNTAAERMFGWSIDEVLDRIPPFVSDDQIEEFHKTIGEAGRGEQVSGLERRRRKKDGSGIDVAIWTAPLRNGDGSIGGIMSAVADISEKKKLEEQLRHSQKMEAVGRLAGGVAHDFNNLLTIINGYGHMMMDSLDTNHRLHGQAEEILKAGNQAASLTTQLLAFSRRQMIQPKPVDLNHIITNIEKMLRRVIGEDIVLCTNLGSGLGQIKADTNQMEQVLINLVANARDAMPHGGTITIATTNVILDLDASCAADVPTGAYVKLAVTDTGEGMDAETRSHLFEPFYTTKDRGKGTGLGLSSVYGSVRQNGGGVAVVSELGKGSSFSIYLPHFHEICEAEPARRTNNGVSGGNETILLVEDEAPLRRLLRDVMTNAGYHILEAGDGAEALHKWERHAGSIDLLLTDVVMPLMNGHQLAKRFSQIAPRMKVIYMSGYADDVIAFHGVVDAKKSFIQKPFLPHALMAQVREVLDAGRPNISVPVQPPKPAYHRANVS
jgi:PAS domain S-box-containing protein